MDKYQFGLGISAIVAGLQTVAWLTGKNGQVFALTSLVIGGIAGAIFKGSFGKVISKP